jgi:hypothetical protein
MIDPGSPVRQREVCDDGVLRLVPRRASWFPPIWIASRDGWHAYLGGTPFSLVEPRAES